MISSQQINSKQRASDEVAATQLLASLSDSLKIFRERCLDEIYCLADLVQETAGKVVVTGVGKSGIIAHKIAATLSSNGTPAVFLNAAEALHGDLGVVCRNDLVLMISSSGATNELRQQIGSLRAIGAKIAAIVAKSECPLAVEADLVVCIPVGSEGDGLNLAPMCSSTMSLVAGDTLAAILQSRFGFSPEDFALFHPGGSLGRRLLLKASDVMVPAEKVGRIDCDVSLKNVVEQLTLYPVGIAVVVDDCGSVLGVITDGDIRRVVLKEDYNALAEQVMTPNPISVADDALLGNVLETMENCGRKVYEVVVVSAGAFVGVVRMHDIVGEEN